MSNLHYIYSYCHIHVITGVTRLVRSLTSPVWELYMCAHLAVGDMTTRYVAGTHHYNVYTHHTTTELNALLEYLQWCGCYILHRAAA